MTRGPSCLLLVIALGLGLGPGCSEESSTPDPSDPPASVQKLDAAETDADHAKSAAQDELDNIGVQLGD